jgi:rhamnosyltransferase subunit B
MPPLTGAASSALTPSEERKAADRRICGARLFPVARCQSRLMKRRIIMATWGSRGDLHPFLAVAAGLRIRGHSVVIATAPDYRNSVEAEGLEFYPIRPELAPIVADRALMRRLGDLKRGTEHLLREVILPNLAGTYRDLSAACRGADVLIGHNFMFACRLVAERFRVPWLSVALQPMAFLSSYEPCVFPGAPSLTRVQRFGRLPRRATVGLMKMATRHWMKPIDDFRKSLGLPSSEGHPLFDCAFSERGTLAWFSQLLATPQPDWPARVTVSGFPFDNRENAGVKTDSGLAAFLAQGEPPLIFTLGTAAVHVAGDFYHASLEAVRRLGCRAVFLVGTDPRNRPRAPLPENVFAADYAPHSAVFPRCSLVVHQGGIGTAAEALRAGRPMLVVPYGMDQPDNAFRLSRLGVARVLPRARYNARRAAKEISALLGDHRYSAAACRVARSVTAEESIRVSCEVIERI